MLRYAVAATLMFAAAHAAAGELVVLTQGVPFPRGLALVDTDGQGEALYVIARGRARDAGGADTTLDDQGGSVFRVDPDTGATRIIAQATSPPFRLLDKNLPRAVDDTRTDRPYVGLRWHEASRSFFTVGFSGIDLAAGHARPEDARAGYFRKNRSDAVFRLDLDDATWHEFDRHDGTGDYPDTGRGTLEGPNNLLVVGDTLYVAAKDNSRVVAFDLAPHHSDAEADAGARLVLGDTITLTNVDDEQRQVLGHSALGFHDGRLYVGFRTTGEVVRLRPDDPSRGELLARFNPFDPETGRSADVTDLDVGPDGDVYVVSAQPLRVYRFTPDPDAVRDYTGDNARTGAFLDLAGRLGNPRMKGENVLVGPGGTIYVGCGDAYGPDAALGGWIYRYRPDADGR